MLYDTDERLNELIERDNTRDNDMERKALFTIFAGNDDLYSKVDKLYDFAEHAINLDGLEQADLSGGAYQLVKLAFNLYSSNSETNVAEVFRSLDRDNYDLALKVIDVHFNKNKYGDGQID